MEELGAFKFRLVVLATFEKLRRRRGHNLFSQFSHFYSFLLNCYDI